MMKKYRLLSRETWLQYCSMLQSEQCLLMRIVGSLTSRGNDWSAIFEMKATLFNGYVPDTLNSRKLLIKGRSDFKREKESDEKVYLFKSSVSMSTQTDAKRVISREWKGWYFWALWPLTPYLKLQYSYIQNSVLPCDSVSDRGIIFVEMNCAITWLPGTS